MIFKVYLMRRGGRRLSWLEIANGPAYVGDLRTATVQCKEFKLMDAARLYSAASSGAQC